jgi:uncharacterized protein
MRSDQATKRLVHEARMFLSAGRPRLVQTDLMDQRLSIVTLGVHDLAAARAFYQGVLGWQPTDETPGISFYNVGSMMLGLYPSHELADDIGIAGDESQTGLASPSDPTYRGFTLALTLASREQVDTLFAELKSKDVPILKEPQAVFWGGYSGYFADPDGNAWEVAHNPFWDIGDDGRPVAPGSTSR